MKANKSLMHLLQISFLAIVLTSVASCGLVSHVYDSVSGSIGSFFADWVMKKIQVGIKVPKQKSQGRSPQSNSSDLEFLNFLKLATLQKEDRMILLKKIYSYMGTDYLPVGGGCRIQSVDREGNRLNFVLDYCAMGVLLTYVPSHGIVTEIGGGLVEGIGKVVADVNLITSVDDIKRPNLFAVVKLTGFGIQVEFDKTFKIQNLHLNYNKDNTNFYAIMSGCHSGNREICDPDRLTHNTINWATDKLSGDSIDKFDSWVNQSILESVLLFVFGPLIDDAVSLKVNHLISTENALDISSMGVDVKAIDKTLIEEINIEYQLLVKMISKDSDSIKTDEFRSNVESVVSNLQKSVIKIQPRGNQDIKVIKNNLNYVLDKFYTVKYDSDIIKTKYAFSDILVMLDGLLSKLEPREISTTLKDEIYTALDLYKETLKGYLQPVIYSTLLPMQMVETVVLETEKTLKGSLQEGFYDFFKGVSQIIQPLEESTLFFEDDVLIKRTAKGIFRKPSIVWAAPQSTGLDTDVFKASPLGLERHYEKSDSDQQRIQILTMLAEKYNFENRNLKLSKQTTLDQLSKVYSVFESALLDVDKPRVANAARRLLETHSLKAGGLFKYFLKKAQAVDRLNLEHRYLLLMIVESALAANRVDLDEEIKLIFNSHLGADNLGQRLMELSLKYILQTQGPVVAQQLLKSKINPRNLDECRIYRPLFYLMPSDSESDRVSLSLYTLERRCLAMVY
jgi:hypothetical protein